MRTLEWRDDRVVLIDQTRLPAETLWLEVTDVDGMIDAIARLAVRGAPAIGVAGAYAVAMAAQQAEREGRDAAWLGGELERIARARPTAVNLAWAVDRVRAHLDRGAAAVVAAAEALADDDIVTNRALAELGADLVAELVGTPVRVHTHCNAGGLACVEWGTALGIVRALHERGELRSVTADETRPLLQGSRLTAFELAEQGIEHRIVADGAGPSVIARGLTDVVIVGADRIAANGDVANKIGTYPLALAAARAGVPFIVAAPTSTLDPATATGDDIEIEERDPDEVLYVAGRRTAPAMSGALNPAFDVTPADLVTAIVTEARVIRPAAGERL
ncbi:MAG: S-methyl-5-thioribose-1-phosphate isomerase [Desertimonas sp.]